MNRDEGELILSRGYDPFLNGSTHSIAGVTRGIAINIILKLLILS